MSNRTLIEINHDYAGKLGDQFLAALGRYVRSGSISDAAELKQFGVRVFGMRHHSDGFNIKWGRASPITETESSKR